MFYSVLISKYCFSFVTFSFKLGSTGKQFDSWYFSIMVIFLLWLFVNYSEIQATTIEQIYSTPTWLNLLPTQDNTSIMYILVFIFLTMSWTRNGIIHTIILSWLNLFFFYNFYIWSQYLFYIGGGIIYLFIVRIPLIEHSDVTNISSQVQMRTDVYNN